MRSYSGGVRGNAPNLSAQGGTEVWGRELASEKLTRSMFYRDLAHSRRFEFIGKVKISRALMRQSLLLICRQPLLGNRTCQRDRCFGDRVTLRSGESNGMGQLDAPVQLRFRFQEPFNGHCVALVAHLWHRYPGWDGCRFFGGVNFCVPGCAKGFCLPVYLPKPWLKTRRAGKGCEGFSPVLSVSNRDALDALKVPHPARACRIDR